MSTFTDAKGWYPGIEMRDHRPVLPRHRRLGGRAVEGQRAVHDPDRRRRRQTATDLFGVDIGSGVLGTGNPGDAGAAYNTKVQVKSVKSGNTAAQIRITPPTP